MKCCLLLAQFKMKSSNWKLCCLKLKEDRDKEVKAWEISSVVITNVQSLVERGEHNVDFKTNPAHINFFTSKFNY